MTRTSLKELIPPIVLRIIHHLVKKKILSIDEGPEFRIHPFDSIPKEIEPHWILDVGANHGDVTIAALKSFPDCHVICFEPVKETFHRLSERLLPFQSSVFLFNYALSDTQGTAEINITTFDGANSIHPQAQFHQLLNPHVREIGKEEIELVRLDDIANSLPTRSVDILKIDVEGHELSVLKGGSSFIREMVDTLIIEISFMRDQSWESQAIFGIFSLLNDLGFRLINILDIHHADEKNLLIAQIDCVFRHKRRLLSI